MDVNSLPKTVTRQRRGCDLNPGLSAPESSTLTTRLPSHPYGPMTKITELNCCLGRFKTVSHRNTVCHVMPHRIGLFCRLLFLRPPLIDALAVLQSLMRPSHDY